CRSFSSTISSSGWNSAVVDSPKEGRRPLRTGPAISRQADAVLPRRNLKPPPEGAEETALVGETQQKAGLRDRDVGLTEVLLRQLAARVVQQAQEGGSFRLQPPLQGAFAHLQRPGNVAASRFAIGQAANDGGAGSPADRRMVQALEMFAGEPLMHPREKRMRRRQRIHDVGAGE